MDPTPAARTEVPDRAPAGQRPTIGFPSIPSRSDDDPAPVPVPSIPVPGDPAPRHDATAGAAATTVPATAPDPGGAPDPGPAPDPSTARWPTETTPVRLAALTPPATGDLAQGEGPASFSPAVRAKLKSYVYLLVDPRTGRPFHAAVGRDDRCFDHLRAARDFGPVGGAPDGFEVPVLDRIRWIESSGGPVRIDILRYGLDPSEALLVQAAAHDLLGLPGAPPGGRQRRPAGEVQRLLTKRAKFKRAHQVVLLRTGPPGTDLSYEGVRHGWRIGRRWTDPDGLRSPHWAVVVAGELVDSVYRLERWETSGPGGAAAAPAGTIEPTPDRYSFVGTRDPELEARYAGKSVAPYMAKGSQSSVAYVWCGPHWVNTAQ